MCRSSSSTALRRAWRVSVVMVCITAGCGSDLGTEPVSTLSPLARAYLDEMLDLLRGNSINRHTIDWSDVRAQVFAEAEAVSAATIPDLSQAIRKALSLLRDNHSFYLPVAGQTIRPRTFSCNAPMTTNPSVPATVGYVRVGAFSGTEAEAVAFATSLQQTIRAADRGDLMGWIVDLRGNSGGNMWPMVAGVGPVLGEGVSGHFINADDRGTQWSYFEGVSWESDPVSDILRVRVDQPYQLLVARPRVAVLIDQRTASSGEATAISFKQRPDARFFGTPTCGLSTSNKGFPMSDGAILVIASAVLADRWRTKYGGVVVPDEIVVDPTDAAERAIAWLQSGQP